MHLKVPYWGEAKFSARTTPVVQASWPWATRLLTYNLLLSGTGERGEHARAIAHMRARPPTGTTVRPHARVIALPRACASAYSCARGHPLRRGHAVCPLVWVPMR